MSTKLYTELRKLWHSETDSTELYDRIGELLLDEDKRGNKETSTYIEGPHPLCVEPTLVSSPVCLFCDGIIAMDHKRTECVCPAPQCNGCGKALQGEPCMVRNISMNEGTLQCFVFCPDCTSLLAEGKSIGVGGIDRVDGTGTTERWEMGMVVDEGGQAAVTPAGWICSCGKANSIVNEKCAQCWKEQRPYS